MTETFEQRFEREAREYAANAVMPIDAHAVANDLARRYPRSRSFWLRRLPVLAPAPVRVLGLVALTAMLLALGLSTALLAARDLATVEDLVDRSQDTMRRPPAFTMTSTTDGGDVRRFSWDGATTLRIDAVEGPYGDLPEGAFILRDGNRQATYVPETGHWSIGDAPVRPLGGLEPSWATPGSVPLGEEPSLVTCDRWQAGAVATIAGRQADEVRCGGESWWIDRESAFLVRHDVDGTAVVTVTDLVVGADLPPALFAFEPPSDRPTLTALEAGDAAPRWAAPTLDGREYRTTDATRPTAYLFWGSWCPPCIDTALPAFVDAERERAGTIEFVAVAAFEDEQAVRDYGEERVLPSTVVLDPDGDVAAAWGLDAVPVLVLVDAEGRVASVRQGDITRDSLTELLDELERIAD